jgi:hypothetical protein
MQFVADQSLAPTTIGADLCAIFVSLELSRSTWLATSLSPGRGEKMSKHSVSAGGIAALLARFSELRRKACARTGKSFPILVIQEAGLDASGFTVSCRAKELRVMLSMPPQLRPRAGGVGQDRQDRRRDFASRTGRPQARRTAGLLNGSGANT